MTTSLYQRAGALWSAVFVTYACSHRSSEAPAKTPNESGPPPTSAPAPTETEAPASDTTEAGTVGAERGTEEGLLDDATAEPRAEEQTFAFDCGDQRTLVARIDDEFAYLISENFAALPRVETTAALSAEAPQTYQLGMERVSLTGAHAIITLADGSKLECARDAELSAWVDAGLRGVTFRGVGSEPRFVLEVGPQAVAVVTDDGARSYSMPRPEPERDGDKTIYRGESGAGPIVATIEPGACQNGEQSFQNRVSVQVGDRTYQGCGRAVE